MTKKRILLVDDENAVRILLASALEYDGYEVDIAENGTQAALYLDKTSYDLVITDYMMPEMNGLDLTRMIRSKCPSLPVIIITGNESAYDILQNEATACIIKPFDLFELKDRIKEILGE